jgi:hypothetical protein
LEAARCGRAVKIASTVNFKTAGTLSVPVDHLSRFRQLAEVSSLPYVETASEEETW